MGRNTLACSKIAAKGIVIHPSHYSLPLFLRHPLFAGLDQVSGSSSRKALTNGCAAKSGRNTMIFSTMPLVPCKSCLA